MKKLIAMLLALVMVMALAACSQEPAKDTTPETTTTPAQTTEGTEEVTTGCDEVMTYAEYAAAELDAAVTVECYVQATQGWWEKEGQGLITVYAQDADGAYFLYEMKCSKEDSEKLTEGTKIRVSGYKGEWSGEVEIMDGSFEFVEGAEPFVAEPKDVTELLGTEELINYQNQKVCFKGMTIAASNDEGAAFLYKWDGSGKAGDDLYFNVSVGDKTYTFCVESYLTGDGTDIYEMIETATVGQIVDLEGYLYWYEGVQPHIVSGIVQADAVPDDATA